MKVNRQKFPVLGRSTRHDVGQPGLARARAIHKRTQTLMKEYKERDKANVFADKRLGEYDSGISPEDRMLKRFSLEQQRQHEKRSIYNLNEEEELTHYGQSLADIEMYNDIVDSDSDTEGKGALSAELTATHFGGGGSLQKSSQWSTREAESLKSRRELIEELIARSKQEKRERQAQREDALELTEKLDQDWKEIQGLVSCRAPKTESRDRKKPQPDAYDVMVRELGFEMKAQPSSRMKTEEELAKEEAERLQSLEAKRLQRMLGHEQEGHPKKPTHMSADDLNDGFILPRDDRCPLSYSDGKMDVGAESDQEASDDSNQELKGEDLGEEDEEDEDSGGPNSHSDLDSDEESKDNNQKPRDLPCQVSGGSEGGFHTLPSVVTELPYTFTVPESSEELRSLLRGRSPEEQLLVVERIQKCHHPSLAAGNKAKLQKFFSFLLEYSGDLALQDPPDLKVIDKLVVHLYNLCQMFPEWAGNAVQFVLRNAMHEMEGQLEARGRAAFPGLDVLVYLKVAGTLFPTSDFRHPVVTPALLCMSQLLTKCPVQSLEDAVKGLFVCCLFLEYVSLSQRFVPELINFLLGLLYIATPNTQCQGLSPVHPFRALGKNSELLVVWEEEDVVSWQRSELSLLWAGAPNTQSRTEANHSRLSCLAVCLALLKHCVLMYHSLPSFDAITAPLRVLLMEHLAHPQQPELQMLCQNILAEMESQERCFRPLVCEKSKPVLLKLFTPRLVKVLEYGRKQGSSKEEQERKRLIHKHKREFKGAVREIRKDNQFLARMQLSEVLERDAERKRKVKQLFSSLATQEGEWKALKRTKFKH